MVDKTVPLETLLAGETATISRIGGHGPNVHRLEEFGLRGGSRIRMFRTGNPCILALGGGKVCLRCDPELRILVERAADTPPPVTVPGRPSPFSRGGR